MTTLPGNPCIKAVVFDLDGLMFNTEDIFSWSGEELLRRRDKRMTTDLRIRMMGRRPHEAFDILIETLDLSDSIEDLLAESQEIFGSFLNDHLAPMPGLHELLDHIETGTLMKAVATSAPRRHLEDILGRFSLADRFHVTLAAEDVTHGKPHPEIYLKTAARIGIEPTEMLVLEDSQAGTQAAALADAVVISVRNQHSLSHDFSAATYIADSLDDPYVFELIGGC